MTPIEYTQFRETIRTDHPDLYNDLPEGLDVYSLEQWQEFAVKLLGKMDSLNNENAVKVDDLTREVTELQDQVYDLQDKIEYLEDRLADYE